MIILKNEHSNAATKSIMLPKTTLGVKDSSESSTQYHVHKLNKQNKKNFK